MQVYTCMIHACFKNKPFERTLSVDESIIQEGGRADGKSHSVLARGCWQLHHPSQAVEIIRAADKLPGSTSNRPSIMGVEGSDEPGAKLSAFCKKAAMEA